MPNRPTPATVRCARPGGRGGVEGEFGEARQTGGRWEGKYRQR